MGTALRMEIDIAWPGKAADEITRSQNGLLHRGRVIWIGAQIAVA